MVYCISGRSGSGKTERIMTLIQEKIEKGNKCIVIVPMQQSMEYEKAVFTRFGSRANMFLEVLTFERLPNRTYREYGGLAEKTTDDGGALLYMSKALEMTSDKLEVFSAMKDEKEFVTAMLETSRTLCQSRVSHELLAKIDGNDRSACKARDIHKVLSVFDKLTKDNRDSNTALELYTERLPKTEFFRGKTVFADSFTSFTEEQHAVLDIVANQCDDLYVSLTYDDSESEKISIFANPAKSYNRLHLHSKVIDLPEPSNKRHSENPPLAYAEENLWNTSAESFGGTVTDEIEFAVCGNKFEEAEYAASYIYGLLKKGYRYRDIAIIVRSPETRLGILDCMLEKHGIPCFFSSKDSVLTKPLSEYILSAIECAVSDYPLAAMLKLLRSGYAPIPKGRAERLSSYIKTWNIRGKRFEKDWLMNPSGYKDSINKKEENLLKEINNSRKVIVDLLSGLKLAFKNETTGAEAAKAIFGFLEESRASESVMKKAEALRNNGEDAKAQKIGELWDTVMHALDELYTVFENDKMKGAKLLSRLELLLSAYNIGAVPEYCDAVTIGSAAIFRPLSAKVCILLGVNDGEFPASPSAGGIFAREDIEAFEKEGLYISDDFEKQLSLERLFFYLAVSAPSEKLCVVYEKSESANEKKTPSVGALRLQKLFPTAKITVFPGDYPVFSPESARENSKYASEKIRKALREKGLDATETVKEHPLCDTRAEFSADYSKCGIDMYATRIDMYTKCPFSFFGRYILGVSKEKKAEFSNLEIGNFIHKILELFVKNNRDSANNFICPDDDDIKKFIKEQTEAYIVSVCKGTEKDNRRFSYLLGRIRKSLFLLLKNIADEFSNTAFKTCAVEEDIGKYKTALTTRSGVTVRIGGKIDRVDICEINGKKYIHVVDYKSGSKEYDIKNIENGLDLQMFIYLFAYINGIGGETVPAAVTYMPVLATDKSDDNDESEKKISDMFKQTGVVLADVDVISRLNPASKTSFPARLTSEGKIYHYSKIATVEEFGKLKTDIEKYIKQIGDEISKGIVTVSPLKTKGGKSNPCSYCDMREACRLSGNFEICRTKGNFR